MDNPGGTSTNLAAVDRHYLPASIQKNPEAWNWNFTVERHLPWNSVASVGYVGRRGLHLPREADINQPTTATVAANPGVNLDALRPYKGYNSIRESQNVANSRYNSCKSPGTGRFANGFMFGACLHVLQEHGRRLRTIATSSPTRTMRSNLWALSVIRRHPHDDHQLHVRTAVLPREPNRWPGSCWVDGRSAASRSSKPARRAARW